MEQSKTNSNQLPVIPKWSELCPDLLRSVFERLSFTNLNRAKSVCRSWNSASRGCVPKRNQIPWLILFPRENETNNTNSCVLFIPDDKDKVYKTRDLGLDFGKSSCLATYGSWLLMLDHLCNLYILNLLTLERIDELPHFPSHKFPDTLRRYHSCNIACLWIDDITKDYLVVWIINHDMVFTKNGDDTWGDVPPSELRTYDQIVYNHRDHKVYTFVDYNDLYVWDFSTDIPREDFNLPNLFYERHHEYTVDQNYNRLGSWIHVSTTVPGQILRVDWSLCVVSKTWKFYIYQLDSLTWKWVTVDSLDDDALIVVMGFTVVAKDIPGIKKNSIYFSGHSHPIMNTNHIYVYDITTQTMEPLPQCVFSSMLFSDARWFLPGFTG